MPNDFQDEYYEDSEDNDVDLNELANLEEKPKRLTTMPSKQPLFQSLFVQSVDPDDRILQDFAQYIVGKLSEHFALKAAKGGAFFQKKLAGYEEHQKGRDPHDYGRDQTLRAHLINGMLPALHIVRWLQKWHAPKLSDWDETTERLFIAGYMLHDFTKIEAVKQILQEAGFTEGEAPSIRQIPTLERIFREWCFELGIDAFLQPVGGVQTLLHDLIYVACNTQQLWGTAHVPSLLPNIATDINVYDLATTVSHLADLLAYVAPTPRDMVANKSIHKIITVELGADLQLPGRSVAKLTYHHVAENRGVLLNFIHKAVLEALLIDGVRVPILYAPAGVVYLERNGAPPMPSPTDLTTHIVEHIRLKVQTQTANKKTGYEVSKDGWRVNNTYRDLFDLREFIEMSSSLIIKVTGNPVQYMEFLHESGWPHTDNLPVYSTDKTDARMRQMAEWASLLEIQFEEQMPDLLTNFASVVLISWGINDLSREFEELRGYNQRGVGVRHRWYWAAAHALSRRAGILPDGVFQWIKDSAEQVLDILPEELPQNAQINPEMWKDLTHYVQGVLTLGGTKAEQSAWEHELTHYANAKIKGGEATCAMCGSSYNTREQMTSAVAFQPGVYTGRIRLAFRENKRSMCSICALEQLLRQLFVENLDTGSTAESQRIRYLSFYPSYFFTPETLRFVQRAYDRIKAVRISDKDLWTALRNEDLMDTMFWQGLETFLLRPEGVPSDDKFQRVLRYRPEAQATFLTVGFRNIDPTETESWILPTLLALVFSVCLDVKIVVSDSSVPLLLEASELLETVWFDGAHPAIQALIGADRLNIDQIGSVLARVTAAYLIHLDTEYQPPKENWQRFAPIAHSLMESPLYVFHYLKKQERDDRHIGIEQVRRYIRYAETLFNDQKDKLMDYAKQLAYLYRRFYKVRNPFQASSYTLLRPVDIVADTLLSAEPKLFPSVEALIGVTLGQLKDRLESSETNAIFIRGRESEQLMREFCESFVKDIFDGVFKGDVAALRGKQLNLFRSACEYYYLEAARAEWEARGRDEDESESPES